MMQESLIAINDYCETVTKRGAKCGCVINVKHNINEFEERRYVYKNILQVFDMAQTPKGPIYVYSKQIKEKPIQSDIRKKTAEKENLVSVISSLMEIGKSRPIEQLDLGDNCTDWINEVLEDFSNTNAQKLTLKKMAH
jgi:hypothetical protein